jgi:oligopeptide/dipeptide ABC transporter ATP-binding protein
MIFQDAGSALDPHMTIGEQIGEVFAIHRPELKADERRIKIINLLQEVQISDPQDRMNYYPHQLSGGMQQRVVIAIALALRPKLLLADEPTTALDVTIQAQIMALLSQINAEHRCSVLLVTHDIALAATMCSRILVMYCGQIVEEGPVETVINRPAHPYTQGLLSCVPDMGQRRNVKPIPGEVPRHQLKSIVGCRFANRCALVQDACRLHDVTLSPASGAHRARCILAGK